MTRLSVDPTTDDLEPVTEEFKTLVRHLMDEHGHVLRRLAQLEAQERASGIAMRRAYQRRLRNRRKRRKR